MITVPIINIFFCTSISQFFFLDLGLTLLETFLRIFSHHSLCTHVWPCNLMKRLNVWKKNISNRNRWMLKWRPMMLRMEKLTKVLINDSSKSYLHLKGQSGKLIFFFTDAALRFLHVSVKRVQFLKWLLYVFMTMLKNIW